MESNITREDRFCAAKFLLNNPKTLTQGVMVRKFEEQWSRWLGVKYSVFVNSGSSANLITILALKILKGEGEVIVPTLTWISDIAAVMQNGLKPVFVDINPKNLCMAEEEIIRKINSKTKCLH